MNSGLRAGCGVLAQGLLSVGNVDTAAYRRLDIDPTFRVQLEEMVKTGDLEGMKRVKLPEILPEAGLSAVHPNGNNVSMDRELMEINQNALEYQAMTQFVSSSLSRLKMAITGRIQ